MSKSWLDTILDMLLKQQDTAVSQIPRLLRLEGKGRKGCLFVDGEPGTVRYFCWDGQRLVGDNSSDNVGQTIRLHVDTLLDIASGELSARTAIAAGLVRITGDRSLYQREEIIRIVEKLADWIEKQLRLIGTKRG